MNVPVWAWAAVLAVIVVMLAVDLLAHRGAHVIGPREAALWSGIWIVLGLGFGVVVWMVWGGQAGGEYVTGYLLEKSLAVDNVFVFALLFSFFAVPRELQHRVLFLGVLGALVLRAGFIAAGVVLIERFDWILYVFGAFLVITAVRMWRSTHEVHPERNPVVRVVRRLVPVTEDYRGTHFVVREAGRWVATPLLVVLIAVETTDVVFAVDSIPAVFAVTQEPFLIFTSNAFAILGLRALYFLLADAMNRFVYLSKGLSVVLFIVGTKLLLIDVVHLPIWVSLGAVALSVGVAVVASLRATRGRDRVVEAEPAGSRDEG